MFCSFYVFYIQFISILKVYLWKKKYFFMQNCRMKMKLNIEKWNYLQFKCQWKWDDKVKRRNRTIFVKVSDEVGWVAWQWLKFIHFWSDFAGSPVNLTENQLPWLLFLQTKQNLSINFFSKYRFCVNYFLQKKIATSLNYCQQTHPFTDKQKIKINQNPPWMWKKYENYYYLLFSVSLFIFVSQ